ncbi:hypothetical protein TNCV_2572011 [Trichonephila clavipes]|nr:hypothetical protein TNCV_2572011 [Trichonephila clavipes]
MLLKASGNGVMKQSQTFLWHKIFQEGEESVNDYDRSGRLSTKQTSPWCKKSVKEPLWEFGGDIGFPFFARQRCSRYLCAESDPVSTTARRTLTPASFRSLDPPPTFPLKA